MARRVVVSGMGIVSPLGSNLAANWEKLQAGISGISPIERFDVTNYTTQFAGQLDSDFSTADILTSGELRRADLFTVYAAVAAAEALQDAGIKPHPPNADRIATFIGSGLGGIARTYQNAVTLQTRGPARISPFFVPETIINMAAGIISIDYGFTGPNLALATACTTGSHTIGLGYRAITCGDADVVLAGGAEAPVNELGLGGFMAARSLSTRNDSPQTASRPWDRDRDGFVVSEGAAILVLEEYEQAKRRAAPIYAEIKGFGMSGDAYHKVAPATDGSGAARCMKNALQDAMINPTDIQYINAHGTSTKLGDLAETKAIKHTFGDWAPKVLVNSTKSMTGHLLGAAGAVEAVYSCLAVQHGVVPPTINLDNPDEGCDLDYVPHEARTARLTNVMSNSFGFGGTNASLIFGRV